MHEEGEENPSVFIAIQKWDLMGIEEGNGSRGDCREAGSTNGGPYDGELIVERNSCRYL
jgi:hypothetical protein